jgi:tetratricopeptide (TPR) repeat protein
MEVVFSPAVESLRILQIMGSALRTGMMLACLAWLVDPSGTAWAKGLHLGGSDTGTRVIFDIKVPVSPEVTRKDQTLIVNFPDTVADPQTVTDQFLIQNLTFDGKTASITIKGPFSYKVRSEIFPPRFTVDITSTETGTAGGSTPCPIKYIDTSSSGDTVSVTIQLRKDHVPKVLTSKNGRIFLQFSEVFSCPDLTRLVSPIPQLRFGGSLKLQKGTAAWFALTGKNTLADVKTDEDAGRIVLEIDTSGTFRADQRYAMAANLYSLGNMASVISTLEPQGRSLSPGERVLLARAYWAVAYPYRMKESGRALSAMNEALQRMTPGIERERIMLEYCSMLIAADQTRKAAELIRFLKESAWDEISIHASLQEIDILNRKKLFQDAYVAGRRFIRDLGNAGIPQGLKGYSLTVQGDTYLGLNDHAKALGLYQEALAGDPQIFRKDLRLPARMAEASFNMNDFSDARDYLLQAINLGDPFNREKNLIMLGDCLHQLGARDKAILVYSQVEYSGQKSDNAVVAQLKKARVMLEKDTDERGRVSNATFKKVMKIYETMELSESFQDPSLAYLVRIRIAQAFAKHGDWDLALDAYRRVWQDTKPSDPIHSFARAEASKIITQRFRIFFANAQYDKAYDLYTRQSAFIREFRDPEALFMIGFCLNQASHPEAAKPLLEHAVEDDSAYREQALALLFNIDNHMGYYPDALKWNSRYLELYPSGESVQFMKEKRGGILYLMGRYQDAVPFLEAFAAKGGEASLKPLSYLADAYGKLGMTAREAQSLEKIISLRSTYTSPIIDDALYLRAHQLKRAGELVRARSLYQDLLNLYPRSGHAYWAMYYIAAIEVSLGNYPEAKGLLTNVTRLSNDPILLAAARAASNDMELKRDMESYKILKQLTRGD